VTKHLFAEMDVTRDSILQWIIDKTMAECKARSIPHESGMIDEELRCILGRRYWSSIDETGSFELKQALHEIYMDGSSDTPINRMGRVELLAEVCEIAIDQCQFNNMGELASDPWFTPMDE
jgi:hypothetical protein